MIELDNLETFPTCIREYAVSLSEELLEVIKNIDQSEIIDKVRDYILAGSRGNYIECLCEELFDKCVKVYHFTRMPDNNCILNEGLLTNSDSDLYSRSLKVLSDANLPHDMISLVSSRIKEKISNDNSNQKNLICFTYEADFERMQDIVRYLGGEIIQRSIEQTFGRDNDILKQLKIGKACAISFGCRLEDMTDGGREVVIKMIMMYFLEKKYGMKYLIKGDGYHKGSVLPNDFIEIIYNDNY